MSDLSYEPAGVSGVLHTPKGDVAFRSPLIGQYNLNLLAAVGAVLHLGIDLQLIASAATVSRCARTDGTSALAHRILVW